MPVRVTCPGCQTAYDCPDERCGKALRCTKCQQVFRVPAAPSAVAAEPPAALSAAPPPPRSRGSGVFILVGIVAVLFFGCAGLTVGGGVVYFLLQRERSPVVLHESALVAPAAAPAEAGREKSARPGASRNPEEPSASPEKLAVKAVVGKPFRYRVQAGGQSVRYELTSGPPGMRVNNRGDVEWVPAADAQGTQQFAVRTVEGDEAKVRRYEVEVIADVAARTGTNPRPGSAPADETLKDQSTLPVKAVIAKPLSFQFPNGGGTLRHELLPQFKQRYQGLDLSSEGLLTWTPPAGTPIGPLNLAVKINGRTHFYLLEVEENPDAALALSGPGGWVMLPDGVTLIVSQPDKAQLLYVDTLTNKESKRIDLNFKPGALAFQGQKLFAAAEGSGQMYVLDAATGAVKKEVRVSQAPLLALACHPEKGLVYATNGRRQVWSIDPASGQATDTRAHGMFVAVDPVEGDAVYTGIQGEIKDVIEIRKVGGDRYNLQPGVRGERALLLKYAVKDGGLQAVAANDNAAANGHVLRVSPDGKRVGIVGGGGYRAPAGGKANTTAYSIALFGTDDVKTMEGTVTCGAYPTNLAFHPVLDLGVAEQTAVDTRMHFFKSKSLVETDTVPLGQGGAAGRPPSPDQIMAAGKAEQAHLLTFGGKGTKLIYYDGRGGTSYLRFLDLKLSDQDKETLAKTYGK